MDPNVAKLAVTSLHLEAYTEFVRAWEQAGHNLASTALKLNLRPSDAAQRAYAFHILDAEDPRVVPFVGGVAEQFGEASPREAMLEAGRPAPARERIEIAKAASAFFKEAEQHLNPRDHSERITFNAARVGWQMLDKLLDEDRQGKIGTLFQRLGPTLEDVGMLLIRSERDPALGVRGLAVSREATEAAASLRQSEHARD